MEDNPDVEPRSGLNGFQDDDQESEHPVTYDDLHSDGLKSANRAHEQLTADDPTVATNSVDQSAAHSDNNIEVGHLNTEHAVAEPRSHFSRPNEGGQQASYHHPICIDSDGGDLPYQNPHGSRDAEQQAGHAADYMRSSGPNATGFTGQQAFDETLPHENPVPPAKKKRSKQKKPKKQQPADVNNYGEGQHNTLYQAYGDSPYEQHQQVEDHHNPPVDGADSGNQNDHPESTILQRQSHSRTPYEAKAFEVPKAGKRTGAIGGFNGRLGFQPRQAFTPGRLAFPPSRLSNVVPPRRTAPDATRAFTKSRGGQQHIADQINRDTPGIPQTMDNLMAQFHTLEADCARNDADRQAAHDELQHALGDKRALEDKLRSVEQETNNLSADNNKQKATYSSKFNRLKKFVDGLGNDHSSLRRELSSHLQKHELLVEELSDLRDNRDSLLLQLQSCNEKSVELRNQAIDGLRESQKEMAAATLRISQLEQELNDKVKLLADEKELRSQLRSQLNNTATSNETIVRNMKSSNEAVLDKLFEVHAAMEERDNSHDLTKRLEKLASAIQSIATDQAGVGHEAASLRGLIEELSESFSNISSTAPSQSDNDLGASIKSYIDDAMRTLQADVSREQDHQEKIRQLEKQEGHISELDVQLKATQASETQLKEQLASLRARATEDGVDIRLSELSQEMQSTQAALESTNLELDAKIYEIRKLTDSKAEVDGKVESLRQRLDELQAAPPPGDVENLRKEMSKQAAEHRATQKAAFENEKKKLGAERDRLAGKVKQMENALAACTGELEKYKSEHDHNVFSNQEYEEQRDLADQRKSAIDTLQSSLGGLQNEKATIQAAYDKLKAHSGTQKQYLEDANGENSSLVARVVQLENDIQSARTGAKKGQENIKELERRLKEAQDGAKQLNDSSNAVLDEEKKKASRNVKDLQDGLAECQAQLQDKVTEHEEFISDLQRSWENEQKKQKEELAAANRRAFEAKMAKDEAVADIGRLRAELTKRLSEDAAHAANSQRGNGGVHMPVTRINSAARNTAGDRPRSDAVGTGIFRAGDDAAALRPVIEESQQATSPQPKGPVVEESQDAYTFFNNPPASSSPLTVLNEHTSSQIEVPATQQDLQSASQLRSQPASRRQAPDSVPETQLEIEKHRFSLFNSGASNAVNRQRAQQAIQSDFEVFQDSCVDVDTWTKNDHGSRPPLKERPEMIDYQFKKPMPPPNSSQKMTRPTSGSQHPKQSTALSSRSQMASRFQTPEPQVGTAQSSPVQSSSPGFMGSSATKHGLTTYAGQTPRENGQKPSLQETCAAPPKRKADSQIVEGYEAARKKRPDAAGINTTDRGRSGLRSLSQPSIPTELSLSSSQPVQPPATRMRSSAGTAARQVRGTKKKSKNDEINARFAQELDGS